MQKVFIKKKTNPENKNDNGLAEDTTRNCLNENF